MDAREIIAGLVENAIREAFPEAEVPKDIAGLLEVPPDSAMGDYAFPCFRLSKALRMGPPQIAEKLRLAVNAPGVAEAKTQGGYLNFFFDRTAFAKNVLDSVLAAGGRWGSSDEGKGKTVCID